MKSAMKKEIRIVGTLDEIEVEYLIDQVNSFIEKLYLDMSNGFHLRAGGRIDETVAFNFFRSKERMDNIKILMQYLVYFVKDISVHNLGDEDLVNPYEQFKEFIRAHINMLLQDDVRQAIMREFIQITPLEDHKLENFEKRINNQHRKLIRLVETAPIPTADNFFKLFDTLRQFSRFWFDIKNQDHRRIRRSDFYVYKFSRLLIEKYMH